MAEDRRDSTAGSAADAVIRQLGIAEAGAPATHARVDPALRGRYRRIMRFATRVLVQSWWYELVLPTVGLRALANRSRTRRMVAIARRFHPLAVELGGLMIKVGQFLSSRLDVLPPEVTAELADLQDEAPPVPFDEIRHAAEASLGVPLDSAFERLDPVPLAAASLGQAHRGVLRPEDAEIAGFADVVVKIQRPGIERIVDTDLAALERIGRILARVRMVSRRVDAPALVAEFAAVSRDEIDYLHEAASAERFALNTADRPGVGGPRVAWERTTRNVLVLEDVSAIKISDVAALRAAGIDPTAVAHAFATAMLDQVFLDGPFHADPHPGNVFVTPDASVEDGFRLTFIDFGMMGEVSGDLRERLQTAVIAVVSRDGAGVVRAFRDVGMLLPSADTAELERALTALFDRFGGMGFAELQQVDPREFRDFAREFGDVVRELPFQLPENFLLLIRAVSLTSGVCSALDPAFNIWNATEPYAMGLMSRQTGGALRGLGKQAVEVAAVVARLPQRADKLITTLDEGRLVVDTSRLERRVERLARRVIAGVVFAGLIIGGAVVHGSDPVLGAVLMIGSAPVGAFALFSRSR